MASLCCLRHARSGSCGWRRQRAGAPECVCGRASERLTVRSRSAAAGLSGCALTQWCVAFLLRVSVAVLLELTELAKPVEMPCLCCNTHSGATCSTLLCGAFSPSSIDNCGAACALFPSLCESVLLFCSASVLLSCSNSPSWPSRSRCRVLQQRQGISTGLAWPARDVAGVTTETRHLDRLGQPGEMPCGCRNTHRGMTRSMTGRRPIEHTR